MEYQETFDAGIFVSFSNPCLTVEKRKTCVRLCAQGFPSLQIYCDGVPLMENPAFYGFYPFFLQIYYDDVPLKKERAFYLFSLQIYCGGVPLKKERVSYPLEP